MSTLVRPGQPMGVSPAVHKRIRGRLGRVPCALAPPLLPLPAGSAPIIPRPQLPDGPASNAGRPWPQGCPSSVNTSLPSPSSPRAAPLPARGGGAFPLALKTPSIQALSSFFHPNMREHVL